MTNEVIKTPIVPPVVSYYEVEGTPSLDLQSICSFIALGFFPGDSTYFTNKKAFRPATTYNFDQGRLVSQQRYFQWQYHPVEKTFEEAVDEFTELFEGAVARQTKGNHVILPISGGLDSRSLAVAMQHRPKEVYAYSYEFKGGIQETRYGREVAHALGFPFESFQIPPGYLWSVVDQLANVNGCYAEFINPRQMAIWGRVRDKGDMFLLGHGGDLFLDGMGVPDEMTEEQQVDYLLKKLIKPEAHTLASELWACWGLPETFSGYIQELIRSMLQAIPISNANARLRAFKTEYYVARWTAVNLEIFRQQRPVSVPFFDDALCHFVCHTPESLLSGRKIQIEYLRRRSPAVASVAWQKYYPCNLYNYERFNSLPVIARRAWNKGMRLFREWMGHPESLRNWELQFLGDRNTNHLQSYLLGGGEWIPASIRKKYWEGFTGSPENFVQAITMLLTLSLFERHFLDRSR